MNAAKAFDFGLGLNNEINGGQWLPELDNGRNSYPLLYRAVLVARKSPPIEGFPAAVDGGITDVNKQSPSQFSEAFSPNPSSKLGGEDSLKKKKIENKPPRKHKYFWPKIDDKSKPQKTPKNASTTKRGRKPKVSTSPKESPISEPQTHTCSPNSSPPCPVTPTIHEPLLQKLEQTPDKEHGCCLTSLRNVIYATYGDRDRDRDRDVRGTALSNFGGRCRRALDFGFEDSDKDKSVNDIEGVKEDPRKLRAELWKKNISFFEGNVGAKKKRSNKKWLKKNWFKRNIFDSLIKHFKSLSCNVSGEHTCSNFPRGQTWNCRGVNQAHLPPRCNQNGSNIRTAEGSQILSEKEKKVIERALVKYQLKGKSEMILYNIKKKFTPKVDFDHETISVWNLLMMGEEDIPDPEDEKTKAWWKKEKKKLHDKVKMFITRMRFIQGDRTFSRWKGSVVDSVVGVFLTQNVSDVLSSSAFMSLASKYPINSKDHGCGDDDNYGNPNTEDPNQNQQQNNGCGYNVKDGSTDTHSQNDNQSQNNGDKDDVKDGSSSNTQGQNHNGGRDNVKDGRPNTQNQNQYQQRKSTANQNQNQQQESKNWDELREKYSTGKPRSPDTYDSVDYEAVRRATVEEISEVIKDRGQNTILAKRIKDFLDRLVREHGSIDLEWLRDVPPHDVKEFLLSIEGIGLKSVECIRLLCLQHHAFPVDTNVARVAVRLGWVPLKTLPENILFHELEKYPSFDVIQKYLWAWLYGLPQDLLYELHYHMITAGKVFCPKSNPNCNVCPMKEHCKYFASKFASIKLQLPGPQEQTKAKAQEMHAAGRNSKPTNGTSNSEPIIQLPATPGPVSNSNLERDIEDLCRNNNGPIIEMPASPGPVSYDNLDSDIEDLCCNNDDDDEIPTIVLNPGTFRQNLLEALEKNKMARQNSELVKAIVAIRPEDASFPPLKFKILGRLRTVHIVYELDDESPILKDFEKRVPEDPCPYLFRMWMTGDSEDNIIQEYSEQIVFGTILIPCRTATRGFFPLNGTYFQPNEVFADDESSQIPIPVHRDWLWNRPMRYLYCGTMVSSIHRGFSNMVEVRDCCQKGYYCSRGFERKTRGPRTLSSRFHPPNKVTANKKGTPKNNKDDVVVDE